MDRVGALGDPTRRAIFELVAERARAVGEIASYVPVTRSAVSQHLKVLKDAGLVRDLAQGTRRIYQADPDGLAELHAYFERFWSKSLLVFQRAQTGPTTNERKG